MNKYKIPAYLAIILLAMSCSAFVDYIWHPGVRLFDSEHIVEGAFLGIVTLIFILSMEHRASWGRDEGSGAATFEGIGRYGLILGIVWTLVIFFSLVWNITRQKKQTTDIALIEAKTVYEKDNLYYRWATNHHGLFVPITDKTKPNPFLEHFPEHKVVTASGKALTLVNPEYMVRQVYEMQTREHGPQSHITSLDPIRPENAADEWERLALETFEKGAQEVSEVQEIKGKPYLRLMRPMVTEEGCLKCHAAQGYDIGDIRGGISVSIPLTPLQEISNQNIITYFVVHAILWLLGLAGILYGSASVTRSVRRVERAEARTRSVIENMLDGLITLDGWGQIESLNSAASEMFGYAPDEVVGLKMTCLLAELEHTSAPEDTISWCEEALAYTLANERPRELMGKRKDGTPFPLELSVSEMSVSSKRVFIVMARDITARKRAEKALLSSQKQIIRQEKLVSLGTMVAGIAHEINNPAQAINFSMEGLKMNIDYVRELIVTLDDFFRADSTELEQQRAELQEKVEELRMDLVLKCIADITERNVSSIERIDHIINSTKRMANSEEAFRPCDVNTIINDAVTLTHNQIKYKANLELDLADNLPKINGLVQELGQVFMNMLINARDAIVERGLSQREGLIKISSRYSGQHKKVEIRFEDNGVGICKEFIDKIFDPFFTTKAVGEGMGLGLNICHRIIEAHGGEILVESAPGQGTTFIIRIDVREAD